MRWIAGSAEREKSLMRHTWYRNMKARAALRELRESQL